MEETVAAPMASVAWGEYGAVLVLGILAGLAELFTRYRSAPFEATRSKAGIGFCLLNGAASAAVLFLFRVLDFDFGVDVDTSSLPDPELAQSTLRVLAAGFGAIAFLGTTFTSRVAGQTFTWGVGPALEAIFNALNLSTSRVLAGRRASKVREVMHDLDFAQAADALPALCIQLWSDQLAAEDQTELGQQIDVVRNLAIDDAHKLSILGVLLANAVGEGVLQEAVETFRSAQP